MQIKFLQLNMYMGKKTDNLLAYIKKEQFDILSLQEVSGDAISFDKTNTFQRICDLGYDGELSVTWRYKGSPHSFFGSAVFFKPEFTYLSKEEIWLKPYMEIQTLEGFNSEEYPKAVIGVTLEREGKRFIVYSAHLAWSPRAEDDTPEKIRQAMIFENHIASTKMPFILSGDFNAAPHSKVVRMIDRHARNLTSEYRLTNTMNLRLHRHKEEMIEAGGVVVDYMYVTKDFTVNKFDLIDDIDLSDHLGLLLEATLS